MKNILIVVGTRPNYIKVTQFKKVANEKFKGQFDIKIVHTGQHFDRSMADVFFEQLEILPDYLLNIPKGSPNIQMGEIMIRMEKLIREEFTPDLMLVPGDVNSTLAAGLTANKLNIPLGHLESGLRSFDRTMPEEINRILVDEISDYFFVTEQSGLNHLKNEGKPEDNIHFVGNTMIDTLVAFNEQIISQATLKENNLYSGEYILLTMHRPSTVDHKTGILKFLELLNKLGEKKTVVFPMHPRTMNSITKFGLKEKLDQIKNLVLLEPLDYFNFQNLVHNSALIITDSGGIQEEATFKRKPCLTLRPNTERPSTIDVGTNTLLNFELQDVLNYVDAILENRYKKGVIPDLWDGKATERILSIIADLD